MASRSKVRAERAVFVAIVVVIVGAMGLVSFEPQPLGRVVSSSSSTTIEQQTLTYSSDSPSGLQLKVKIDAPIIQSGSALWAHINLFNPLPNNLSITPPRSSNSSIATWNDYDFVCGGNPMWDLAGYALFKGHYSPINISSAGDPLMLAPPVILSCITRLSPNQFVFSPNSSDGMASSTVSNEPPAKVHLATTARTEFCEKFGLSTGCPVGESLIGYWSAPIKGLIDGGDATTNSSYFHYFSPGQFTLVVQDTWGQTIYARFQVVPSSQTTLEVASTGIALPEQCSGVRPNSGNYEQPFGTVIAGSSPTVICIQLYYYAAAPVTLNLTSALSIRAIRYVYSGGIGQPRSFDGAPNFTITASQDKVVLGGPTDENEGIVVAYTLTSKPGASGTYQLSFLPDNLSRWLIGNQGPLNCGYYGQLVAGDGQPSYIQPSHCIVSSTTQISSSSSTVGGRGYRSVAGVSYALMDGQIYFRVVGVVNSKG